MKKFLSLILTVALLVTLFPATLSFAAEREVSPGVGTLAQAVSSAGSGDTLLLGDGIYYVNSTLYLNKPLTLKAKAGASPIITGSNPLTGWESVGGGIYRALCNSSVTPMVIENGVTSIIARYPNQPQKANFSDGYIFATGGSESWESQRGTVNFSASLPSGISTDKLEVVAWGSKWTNYANTVLKATAITSGSVSYTGVMKYGVTDSTRFYIRGDKALIDMPGEYALHGGYIYYYPYNAANLETSVSVSVPFGDVLYVSGSNVTLDGISVKGTALGTFRTNVGNSDYVVFNGDNGAVRVTGANVTFKNCTFDGIGSNAVTLAGSNGRIESSLFQNIGGAAVMIQSSGNTVHNNLITKTGREYGGGAAITISNNNNKISHNEIHDNPRWAINISYGNHAGNIIEYNDVYNCNTDSSDTGLIYTYQTAATKENPNIIRYNNVHDSYIYGGMGFGIYLDDDTNYTKVYGNAVHHLKRANQGWISGPIMIKGIGNEVYNNIIANNESVPIDQNSWNNAGNIIIQKLNGNRVTRENILHHNVIYENKHSTMYRIMMDSPTEGIKSCDYNLYYSSQNYISNWHWCQYFVNANGVWDDVLNSGAWRGFGFDTHSVKADPLFVDPANGNYNLKSNSPLYALGFEPLPLSEMGRVNDDALPIPTAVPTAAPTLAPGQTAPPTPVPTAVPTAAPTPVPTAVPTPAPTQDPSGALFTMNGYESVWGSDSSNTSYSNGVFSISKKITHSLISVIPGNDAISTLNSDTLYTVSFDAEVSGGYLGNYWDGWRISLMNTSNTEHNLVRLLPEQGGLTGIHTAVGSQAPVTVDGGTHHYDLVYTANTVKIYCDGALVLEKNDIGFSGTLKGFSISSAQADATGCTLTLSNLNVFSGNIFDRPVTTPSPARFENVKWVGSDGRTLTATVVFEGLVPNQTATLCVVTYDVMTPTGVEQNKLNNVFFQTVTTDENGTASINLAFVPQSLYIKAFLWEDLSTLNPFSPVALYNGYIVYPD